MSENVGTAIRLMKHKCPNCGGDLETVVSATPDPEMGLYVEAAWKCCKCNLELSLKGPAEYILKVVHAENMRNQNERK